VVSAVFSADGRRVVTASGDTTARVWDLGGPSPTAIVLVGHRDPVLTAAFSPDGRRLVTASGDTTARIWDLGGQPPAAVVLEAQRAPLLGATFSPDGRRVLTVSSDDVVRLWPYVPDAAALIEASTRALTRCLTVAQREAFGLPAPADGALDDRDRVTPPPCRP
jgi:WD40 repeat protein